jgi:hypothetical protein
MSVATDGLACIADGEASAIHLFAKGFQFFGVFHLDARWSRPGLAPREEMTKLTRGLLSIHLA